MVQIHASTLAIAVFGAEHRSGFICMRTLAYSSREMMIPSAIGWKAPRVREDFASGIRTRCALCWPAGRQDINFEMQAARPTCRLHRRPAI